MTLCPSPQSDPLRSSIRSPASGQINPAAERFKSVGGEPFVHGPPFAVEKRRKGTPQRLVARHRLKKLVNQHGASSAVSLKKEMRMNKNFKHNDELLTASASQADHFRAANETLPCHWRRFGPFGMRISVRPGPRSRVVHRVLRKNERAGFLRAITND